MVTEKACRTCKVKKPSEEFGKSARSKNGRRGDCKKCLSKKQMDREDKQKRKEYMAKYYQNNKDKYDQYREKSKVARNHERRERYKNDLEFREEAKRKVKDWQEKNPKKRKTQRLKKYGISYDQYKEMLDKADYQCEICGHSCQENKFVFPIVDHCHETGNVRGILCALCNKGLGSFKDNPEILQSAIYYLVSKKDTSNITSTKSQGVNDSV